MKSILRRESWFFQRLFQDRLPTRSQLFKRGIFSNPHNIWNHIISFEKKQSCVLSFILPSLVTLFVITKRDMYINIWKSRVSSGNSWTIVLRAFDIFSSYFCNLQSSFQTSLCTLHPIQNCLVMTTQNILSHLRRSLYIHKKQYKIESIYMCIEANRQRIFRHKSNHYLIADWRYERWSW